MEADNEIKGEGNSYTTDFRQYDPRIGRWLSLDPLMTKYPEQSAFAGFNNNPIYFKDPTGLEGDPPGEKDKERVNIALVIKDRVQLSGDPDTTLEGEYENLLNTNYVVIEAKSPKDALEQIEKELGDDKIINTLFISSHGASGNWVGAYRFKIGTTKYKTKRGVENSKNLKKIGSYIATDGKLIIAACHAGSEKNGGESLMKTISKTIDREVFASRSWAYTTTFNSNIVSHWLGFSEQGGAGPPSEKVYNQRKYLYDNDGTWIKVTPNSEIVEIVKVSFGKSGQIWYSPNQKEDKKIDDSPYIDMEHEKLKL